MNTNKEDPYRPLHRCPACKKMVTATQVNFSCSTHYSCTTVMDRKYTWLLSCDECGVVFRRAEDLEKQE